MKYDTSIARNLQERYHGGEPRILTLMYLELRRLAGLILSDLCTDNVDVFSHEAATGIVQRYLENPAYKVGSFYEVVKRECLDAISERDLNPSSGHKDRPKTRAHTAWVELDNVSIPIPEKDTDEDDPALLDGLYLYFSNFKWYRPAIRQLMIYIPKKWMLDHAKQLKQIFLEARDGQSSNESSGRRISKSKSSNHD